jgi:HEAT repeat protein
MAAERPGLSPTRGPVIERTEGLREEQADELVSRLQTVAGWRVAFPRLDAAGPAVAGALMRGLAHPHPRVRQWCAALLDHHADSRCVPGLVGLLDDPVAAVRRHAVHSLGCQPCKAAPLAVDVVDLLLERIRRDPSVRVRRVAVHLLGCQPADPRALAALTSLATGDPDPRIRRVARWGQSRHQPALPARQAPTSG